VKFAAVLALTALTLAAQQPPAAPQAGRGRGAAPAPPPRVTAKPEELAKIREKSEQIEALVKDLRAKHADPALTVDVEVYAKAGRMLLEYPEMFGTQAAIDHSFEVLDQGLERAHQLLDGKPQWDQGPKRIEAYRSEIDGSLEPYGLTFPANYDPAKPATLYVWLHGRANDQTESEFIYAFPRQKPGNAPVADQGQIQLDCFGRVNGAGWHWAGEREPFEAVAAVKKRYRIDDKRIVLRGFSQGGEGARNIALHYPDAWVAAEVGAGTVSTTAQTHKPPLEPFQLATLNIWENMSDWALNIYNLPFAGHDGENDARQLESSLRDKAQLAKEGYPFEGPPDYQHSVGAPGLWLQSLATGHGTSPLVRQRLDAFLKEWTTKGQVDPDHIRFVTYTTRYNKDYWISVEGMDKHYERADVDALRSGGEYTIRTHNVSRLVLREMDHAKDVTIDGTALKAPGKPEIALEKANGAWKLDRSLTQAGLHKTHALQGPIDDAFLDPFMMVRPTGTPWNDEVNQQALRSMARFDRMWGKFFRGHPFVKDDKDVTDADMAKYHIVLFGDPGSNKLIARLNGKLPVKWTKDTVTMAGQDFPAKESFPAMIYPNPLHPSKYVVLNTGLTIEDRGYNGDYGTPLWGDYAVVKVKPGAEVPDLQIGGLFDENWRVAK
jgi:hypothetical protein